MSRFAVRHPDVVQRDVRLPDRALTDLSGDQLGRVALGVAGQRLEPVVVLLDDEALDLAVGDVAGPDDDQVGDVAVADPPLAPVEQPVVAVPPGRGRKAHGVRAVIRLGQGERPDLVQPGHRGQPALLLLLGAEHVDRAHRETVLHTEEGVHAAVPTGQLERHHAGRQPGQPGTAVPSDRSAADAERSQLRHQLERELGPLPVVVDHRQHIGVDESPHAVADLAFLIGQQLGQQVEVGAAGGGQIAGEIAYPVGCLGGHRCASAVSGVAKSVAGREVRAPAAS